MPKLPSIVDGKATIRVLRKKSARTDHGILFFPSEIQGYSPFPEKLL